MRSMLTSHEALRELYTRVLRYRNVLGVVVTASLAGYLGTSTAHAGTYVMRSCNVPGERPASVGPWTWIYTSAEIYANDECSRGGGFGLSASTISHGNVAAIHLGIPTEGAQRAITIRRVRLWMIARLSGGEGNMYANFSSGTATQVMAQDLYGPPGGSTLTTPFVSPVLLAETKAVFIGLSCSGGNGGACSSPSANPLEIRGAEVTLYESNSPSGVAEGGSLLERGAQSGVRTLAYTAADAESGVAEVTVLLGGVVVASHDYRAECTYAGLSACATTRRGSAVIDTRGIKDGDYPLTLRVVDAAGNRETITTASTITVANGARGGGVPNNGIGATRDARLAASFVGRARTTARARYYEKLTISGRLRTSSGAPISRAKLEIVETGEGVRRRSATQTVTTGADGRFRSALRRRGTSRKVQVVYRPVLESTAGAVSRLLRVRVSAAGNLRVSLRGVRVSYAGRVVSAPIPRGGKLVYLEGRAIGGRWTRFAIRRTNRHGRFSGRYRLRVRRPGIRLQFRLRIPSQKAYPYAPAVGKPVTRTVR